MSSPALFYANDRAITRSDLEGAIRAAGIGAGDALLVHSDMAAFGKLGDLKDRNLFLGSILDAFLSVLGPKGTLVVPTFTYSFCRGEVFDLRASKSTVGIFSEFVRTRPAAIRSEDAIFSHSAIGPLAGELLEGVGTDCFGPGSFYERLLNHGGKISHFGKVFEFTFIHYIEQAFGVDYRASKDFSGTLIRADGSSREATFNYLVRRLPSDGMEVAYDMPLLAAELERRGLFWRAPLGDSEILCSNTRDSFAVGTEMLRCNPYAFLKHDPRLGGLKGGSADVR